MKNKTITTNRKIKDSVFTHLFSDAENLKCLYESLFHQKIGEEEVRLVTLQNIIVKDVYNDLGFMVGEQFIVVAEAQSTYNPNMALRFLIYIAATLKNYLYEQKINIYSTQKIRIPTPTFIPVYTGKRRMEEELKISGLYSNPYADALQLKVRIVTEENVSEGILKDYISFCKKFDEMKKGKKTKQEQLEAVKETIVYCKARGILKEYFEKKEKEVQELMISMYTQEEVTEMMLREVKEEGREEGREEGKVEGKHLATYLIAKNLKENSADIKLIMKTTGLSKEEIEKL